MAEMKNSGMNKALKRLNNPDLRDFTPGRDKALLPSGPGDRPIAHTQSLHPYPPQTTDKGYVKYSRPDNTICGKRKRENYDSETLRPGKMVKKEREARRPTTSKKPYHKAPTNVALKKKADDENIFSPAQGSSSRNNTSVKKEKIKSSNVCAILPPAVLFLTMST
ncbi:hypothetical protein BDZ89DRAFT_1045002 [Hymenopellis radicata]|nr:hypothetical protein BDZ89DRAFT_1045002 [Hymenopellis radicata]